MFDREARAVVEFADQFSNPVIVLHKLPFHTFETFVSYRATWREIPTDTVDAYRDVRKSLQDRPQEGVRSTW